MTSNSSERPETASPQNWGADLRVLNETFDLIAMTLRRHLGYKIATHPTEGGETEFVTQYDEERWWSFSRNSRLTYTHDGPDAGKFVIQHYGERYDPKKGLQLAVATLIIRDNTGVTIVRDGWDYQWGGKIAGTHRLSTNPDKVEVRVSTPKAITLAKQIIRAYLPL